MAKQAYVAISDLAFESMGCPEFDNLKTGYIGNTANPGRKYEVTDGIPATAKLNTVIYVYEDESLEDVPNPLSLPSITIWSKFCDNYDRVMVMTHLPVNLAGPLFREAVKEAKQGKKILWECSPEEAAGWREGFLQHGCNTYLLPNGVEVGPPDPTI